MATTLSQKENNLIPLLATDILLSLMKRLEKYALNNYPSLFYHLAVVHFRYLIPA